MRARISLQTSPTLGAMGIPRHGETQPSDDYLLPEHWCFHIYSYEGTLELDGTPFALRPGYASLIPAGVRMVYRYRGPSEHVYFHFKPCEGERTVEVPMVLDLAEHYHPMEARAKRAIGHSMTHPSYAVATLWSLLWEVAGMEMNLPSAGRADGHPLVNLAVHHIEQSLGHSISVAQLCTEVGVSYGYLGRLFKIWLGEPVSNYIRRRRAEQAEHLLRSTTLPIKVIARTVGVPSLQQFNRLMHEMKGAGPRTIRSSHRAN